MGRRRIHANNAAKCAAYQARVRDARKAETARLETALADALAAAKASQAPLPAAPQTAAEAMVILAKIREYAASRSYPRNVRRSFKDPGLVPVPAPDFTVQTAVTIIQALSQGLKPRAKSDLLNGFLLAVGSSPYVVHARAVEKTKGREVSIPLRV
jgi:hypothetical protein